MRAAGLISMLSMFAVTGTAGAAPPPGANEFKNEVHRALTAEIVLPYVEKTYAKPVTLALVPRTQASFATPEEALQVFFSSLAAADVAWNDQTWTAASLRFNKAKDREEKRAASYWPERWKQLYGGGKKIDLLRRIEFGKYVIVEYAASVPGTQQPFEQDTLALVRVDEKWLLTQELGRNPIMFVTKAPPNGRIQLGPSVFDMPMQ